MTGGFSTTSPPDRADGTIFTDYPGFNQWQMSSGGGRRPPPSRRRSGKKPAAERPQRGNKAQQAARRQLTICEQDTKAEDTIAALEADMEAAAWAREAERAGGAGRRPGRLDALYRWEQRW